MISFTYNNTTITYPENIGRLYTSHYTKNKFYEFQFLDYIAALNLDKTYLDVGGNIGNHALYFALFTKAKKIFCFEPISEFYTLSKTYFAMNNVGNKINHLNLGISNFKGEQVIEFANVKENCKISTLDDTVPKDQTIDLIKIDVEGMELNVLQGAKNILMKKKPLIYFEAIQDENHCLKDVNITEINAFLHRYGYRHTGRIFNYQPTYEFAHYDNNKCKLDKIVKRKKIDASELHFTAGTKNEATNLSLKLNGSSYISTDLSAFDMPSTANKIKNDANLFVEIDCDTTGDIKVQLYVNHYDNEKMIKQETIYINRRAFYKVEHETKANSIRVILKASGEGMLKINTIAYNTIV